MRVLVPLDRSELSEQVLAPLQACLRAKGEDAEVLLLTVVEPAGTAAEADPALDEAEAYLQGAARRLEGCAATRSLVRRGDPAEEILSCAAEEDVDLVAMSTHGRTGVSRWLRGSVAERVLRTLEGVPLLLVNPSSLEGFDAARCFRSVLVPLDGSAEANRILPRVQELGASFGAEVTLLRVQPFAPAAVPSPILAPSLWDPRKVEKSLEPQAERLREAGLTVRVEARIGDPAAEIVDAAVEHDLVAMTTHGRSGPSRWWFGSVAEQVVRHCDCPLFVLRSR